MKSRRIAAIIILLVAAITIPLLYIALQQYNIFEPKASSQDPQRITVTNLTETSVSFTWTTPGTATIGRVEWGTTTDLGNAQTDIRDKRDNTTQARRTHMVTLTGLQPNTLYYYRTFVGTKSYPASDSAPTTFKTLASPTTAQPTTLSLYGNISGTNTDVVITAYVQGTDGYGDSMPLSTVLNTDGTWYVNVASARLKSTGEYVNPTATTSVVIINDGGNIGDIVTKTTADAPLTLGLTNTDFSQTTINTALGITTTTSTPVITPTDTVTPTTVPTTTTPTPKTTGKQDIPILPIGETATPTPTTATTTITSDDIYNSFVSPSISNISDTTASVMWLSPNEEAEVLAYGTSTGTMTTTKRDDRDSSAAMPHRLHHLSLSFLTQNTQYYFKTTTDSAARTFTTPLAITAPTTTQSLAGTITNGTGECLVRTQIKRGSTLSSVITTLPDSTYTWSVNIAPVRNSQLTAYFAPSSSDSVITNAFCVSSSGDIWYVAKSQTVQDALAKSIPLTLTKLP